MIGTFITRRIIRDIGPIKVLYFHFLIPVDTLYTQKMWYRFWHISVFFGYTYLHFRPHILTWTDNIDRGLKRNITLSNFSQNGPRSMMFDIFIFTRFSFEVFFYWELFRIFFHNSFVKFIMQCLSNYCKWILSFYGKNDMISHVLQFVHTVWESIIRHILVRYMPTRVMAQNVVVITPRLSQTHEGIFSKKLDPDYCQST